MNKFKIRRNVHKINHWLNWWLKLHNYDCKAFLGNSFYFYPLGNKKGEIWWSPFAEDYVQESLAKEFKKSGLKNDYDIFLLSFFHELGHLNTLSNFSKEYLEEYLEQKNKRVKECEQNPTKEFVLQLNEEHQSHPIEKTATQWATDYINANYNSVQHLWIRIKPHLLSLFDMWEMT